MDMDHANIEMEAAHKEEDGQAHRLSVILCRFADTSGYIQYHLEFI